MLSFCMTDSTFLVVSSKEFSDVEIKSLEARLGEFKIKKASNENAVYLIKTEANPIDFERGLKTCRLIERVMKVE